MENILQSIVKIIIIGSSLTTACVEANRQFLPPPLPYYPNEGFYLPGFVPPYHEPVSVYFQSPHAPPPISYQNMNSYSPPVLFHQNENYNPALLANPNGRYSVPQIFPNRPTPYPVLKQEQKDSGAPQTEYKKPSVVLSALNLGSVEGVQKKHELSAANIIVKEDSQPPFYQDDYNKNYHEEDYTDNYSDESPPQLEPCLSSSLYRYFETPKPHTKPEKYTLCNPYFQPNFGNSVYTVKMPITLLPSRFPPRVEQLIERIQNYFSTYTQQETPKPQNETSPVTTVQPVTEATSESILLSTVMTADQNKKNKTTEIEESSTEETNSEPTQVATDGSVNEQVTQKTIVVLIEAENEETTSTVPDALPEKEPQVVEENAKTPHEVTEHDTNSTESSVSHPEIQEGTTPRVESAEDREETEKSSENQISSDWNSSENTKSGNPKRHMQSADAMVTSPATETKTDEKEESSTLQPTKETLLEVTDKNG